MAEGGKRRGSPWLAFLAGVLTVLVVLGLYMLWRGATTVTAEDIGVDIDLPSRPTLPPITPAPDPAPMPIPAPTPG